MFNEFLITFDIRNITQCAYSFNGTPVIKLQSIVSSILGHVFSIVSCLHFYGRLMPMWQQSGTLQFCSCHGIAGFLVDELQI